MTWNEIFDIFPLAADVCKTYGHFRDTGLARDRAAGEVLAMYSGELSDQDDAPQVWVGLAVAMYMSDELTDAVIKKASKGFAYLTSIVPDEYKTVFIDAGTAVCDLPHTGKKKAYSKPVRYTVPWRDGDTFCYKMSGAYSARFGLDDWNIIARKVGISAADDTQLVCLTLSPPDVIPKSTSELDSLGLLPSFQYDAGYNFMFKISIPSAQRLKRMKFVPIGNFADAVPPYHDFEKDAGLSIYVSSYTSEDSIPNWVVNSCLNYRKFGLVHLERNQN